MTDFFMILACLCRFNAVFPFVCMVGGGGGGCLKHDV